MRLMTGFHTLLNMVDRVAPFTTAQAHCDVPCGIYDPSRAQIAALTVIRMVDLMEKLESETSEKGLAYQNTLARQISEKEDHAKICKDEVVIIWGDYFKQPQIEAHPGVHALVHEILMLGSKVKQTVNRDTAVQLLDKVNEFADIFWQTKGVKTKRVVSHYAPNMEVVTPDL